MSEERLREARTLLVRFILNELVTTEEKRARLHSAAATLYEAASTVRSPLPDAAPSRDAGLDRDALYRRIHALPGLAHHGKGEQCFPITAAVLAALADEPDGAPFPAGVNRADSEGER